MFTDRSVSNARFNFSEITAAETCPIGRSDRSTTFINRFKGTAAKLMHFDYVVTAVVSHKYRF